MALEDGVSWSRARGTCRRLVGAAAWLVAEVATTEMNTESTAVMKSSRWTNSSEVHFTGSVADKSSRANYSGCGIRYECTIQPPRHS